MRFGDDNWPRDALPKGLELNGYRIDGVIGRGGFGITYRAIDAIDQVFAIKECFPRQFCLREGRTILATDTTASEPLTDCLTRFTREAKALKLLSTNGAAGDGVVKVATFFQANGTAYIVMEYLAGETLDELIKVHHGGVPDAQLRDILRHVLRAMGCVHDVELLHRDIKPANIYLRENGRPVLIDFGATRGASHGQTMTFTQIYSEGYAPIEQVTGSAQGPFSDIYAIGTTFYRAIGGKCIDAFTRNQATSHGRPDPQPSAAEIGAGRYDPRLLRMIDAAMIVSPEERPQTVSELVRLLDGEVEDEQDVTAVPERVEEAAEITRVMTHPPPSVERAAQPIPHSTHLADAPSHSHTLHSRDHTKRPKSESVATKPRQSISSRTVALVASLAVVAATGIAVAFWQSRPENVPIPAQADQANPALQQAEAAAARQRAEAAQAQAEAARQQAEAAAAQQREATSARQREAETARQQAEPAGAQQREAAAARQREADTARQQGEAARQQAEAVEKKRLADAGAAEKKRLADEAAKGKARQAQATKQAEAARPREAESVKQQDAPLPSQTLSAQVRGAVGAAQAAARDAHDKATQARLKQAAAQRAAARARDAAAKAREAAKKAETGMSGFRVTTSANGDRGAGDSRLFGSMSGVAVYTFSNGDRYEGEYAGLIPDTSKGAGVYISANGDRYEGEWTGDQRTGLGVATYADKSRYEGDWRGRQRIGMGVSISANGERYEGEWRTDQQGGAGVLFGANSDSWTEMAGQWTSGVANGALVRQGKDGGRLTGAWKNGALEGYAAKYDAQEHVTEQGLYEAGRLKTPSPPDAK